MASASRVKLAAMFLVTLVLGWRLYFAMQEMRNRHGAQATAARRATPSGRARRNASRTRGDGGDADARSATVPDTAETAGHGFSLAERREIERKKRESLARPSPKYELSAEFKANPDLYEEGPGPHAARYGFRSGALPKTLRPEDAEVTTVLESDGPFPRLSVWLPSFRVSSGAEATLYARLVGEDGRGVVAESVSATIVEKQSGQSHQRTFEAGAPGNYQLVFKPAPPSSGIAQYDYAVFAVTQAAGGSQQVRSAQGAFQVHTAVARVLTSEAAANRKGGDIELELPVQIESPGDYTFYAELWGGDGGSTSVAFGMDYVKQLVRGRYVAKITFGGLVIRDRAANGPYKVRNVRVRKVSKFPFAEADPVGVLLTTPDWRAETFH